MNLCSCRNGWLVIMLKDSSKLRMTSYVTSKTIQGPLYDNWITCLPAEWFPPPTQSVAYNMYSLADMVYSLQHILLTDIFYLSIICHSTNRRVLEDYFFFTSQI